MGGGLSLPISVREQEYHEKQSAPPRGQHNRLPGHAFTGLIQGSVSWSVLCFVFANKCIFPHQIETCISGRCCVNVSVTKYHILQENELAGFLS